MFSLKTFIYLCVVYLRFVNGVMEKSSLTFVIDDTGSMQSVIDQVRYGVNLVFDTVKNSTDSPIGEFILVTFNDLPEDALFLTKTTDRDTFREKVSLIKAHGGGDCPEASLSGILLGLKESLKDSFLYVFTDDEPDDISLIDQVQNLAIEKNIQVSFILTQNRCGNKIKTYTLFNRLAQATLGTMIYLRKGDVFTILKLVANQIETRQTEILSKILPAGYGHNITFPVDADMKDATITCIGKDPKIGNVVAPDGSKPTSKKIVDLPSIVSIKIPNAMPGNYTAHAGSASKSKVTGTATTNINFKYGFSPDEPTSMNSTVTLPISDVQSHIVVQILSKDKFTPSKVILSDKQGNLIKELPLKLLNDKDNLFITDKTLPPDGLFKLSIFGFHEDSKTNVTRGSKTFIEPQKYLDPVEDMPPKVEIDKGLEIKVKHNDPLKLVCNVEAYPKPNITWQDEDGSIFPTEVLTFKKPYSYKAALEIEKVTQNKTYTCSAKNEKYDENSQKIKVETERTQYLDIIEKPKDTNIVHRSTGKIYCKADAMPSATTKWHFNSTDLKTDDFFDTSESGTLTIKQMMPHMVGKYSCEVSNGVESKNLGFEVSITGIKPTTSITLPSTLSVDYDTPLSLPCQVKGEPKPKIQWINEKTGEQMKSAPVPVPTSFDYGEELKLEKVTINATYKCIAENNLGEHSSAVTVYTIRKEYLDIIEAPKDINIVHRSNGKIYCKVDALPPATIKWYFNSLMLKTDDFFDTSESGTLTIIQMMPHLVGKYSCEVSNGVESKKLAFKVSITGIKPITSITGPSTLSVDYNMPLTLPCQVKGEPKPKIQWINENTGEQMKSANVPVPTSFDYGEEFQLEKVTINATYKCIAENIHGEHSSAVTVYTIRKEYLDIIEAPKDANIIHRSTGKIYCKVDALPPATIKWYFNSLMLKTDDFFDTSASSTLTIKQMMPHMVGKYSCEVSNGVESKKLEFKVSITGIKPITSITGPSTLSVDYDTPLSLPCQVKGEPKPKIQWINENTGEQMKSAPVPVPTSFDYGEELQLEKVTINATYKCIAENSHGEHTSAVTVYTIRREYLDVLEAPKDTNIVHRSNGKIYCKVDALPPATMKWYFNSLMLKTDDFFDTSESGTLTIKQMMPHMVGKYSCVVSNGVESKNLGFELSNTGIRPITSMPGPSPISVDYNKPLFLPCQVKGEPKPKIYWINEKTGEQMRSAPVAVPTSFDYGEELQLEKVTMNATYRCIAVNNLGEHSSAVTVFTIQKEHFVVIEAPKGTTIEYNKEGVIFCKIDAYPPAKIEWIYKRKPLKNNEYYEISPDGSSLRIKNMQYSIKGFYSCRARNKITAKNLRFKLSISGADKPIIDKNNNNIEVLEGLAVDITCRIIKGNPKPTLTWEFKGDNEDEFGTMDATDSEIHFEKVSRYDSGVYQCVAENVAGKDDHTIYLTVEFKPKIKKSKDHVDAKDRDITTLHCVVEGFPAPKVVWTLNGRVLKDGPDYKIFKDNSIRFLASEKNNGEFICTAKNKHGSDRIKIQVDYYNEVTFDIPPESSYLTYVGEKEKLHCEAYGYPQPTITWLFVSSEASHDEKPKVIKTVNSSKDILQLKLKSTDQDGNYICSASNKKSTANLAYIVTVLEPAHIVTDTFSKLPIKAVKGDLVKIPCRAEGKPKPSITWETNGYPIPTGHDSYSMDPSGTLLIDGITEGGDFVCVATSDINNDYMHFKVEIKDVVPTHIYATYSLKVEKPAVVQCPIYRNFVDPLRWYKNSEQIASGELKFDKVAWSDAGVYTCRVTHRIALKSESKSVYIEVTV